MILWKFCWLYHDIDYPTEFESMIHPTMDYSNDPGGGSNEEINVGSSLNMVPPPHSMMEYQETLLSDPSPFNSLFPALVDCFGIILLGYLAGR